MSQVSNNIFTKMNPLRLLKPLVGLQKTGPSDAEIQAQEQQKQQLAAQLQQYRDGSQSPVDEIKDTVGNFTTELEVSSADVQTYTSNLATANSNLTSANSHLASATATLYSANAALAAAQSAPVPGAPGEGATPEEQSAYSAAVQARDAAIAQAQAAVSAAQAEVDAAQSEVDTAQGEVSDAQSGLETAQADLEAKTAELEQLKNVLQDAEQENGEQVNELQDSIKQIEDSIAQAKQEQAKAEAEMHQAETQQSRAEHDSEFAQLQEAYSKQIAKGKIPEEFKNASNGKNVQANGAQAQDEDANLNPSTNGVPKNTQNKSALELLGYRGNDESQEKVSASGGEESAKKLMQASPQLFDSKTLDGAYAVRHDVVENNKWKVDIDLDGDGQISENEKLNLADAVAKSFDSELDLYIEQQVQDLIRETGCYNFKELFGKEDCDVLVRLAQLGIRADAVGDADSWQNRTYAFSLIENNDPEIAELRKKPLSELTQEERTKLLDAVRDPDAKILTDNKGKEGSIIFADCLVADGMAQGAELNLSSILDTMGYDCFSKADFVGREQEYFELMDKVGEMLANSEYNGFNDENGRSVTDLYTKNILHIADAVRAVYTVNGDAPGQWGGSMTFAQTVEKMQRVGLGSYGGGASPTGGGGGGGVGGVGGSGSGSGSVAGKGGVNGENTNADGTQNAQEATMTQHDKFVFEHEIKVRQEKYLSANGEEAQGRDLADIINEVEDKTGIKAYGKWEKALKI